jgi:hypothetical protein
VTFEKKYYYIKDDSQPFIFLGNIDELKVKPLAEFSIRAASIENLRWDGNISFANSHWWSFPYCFRYEEYRDIINASQNYRIKKIKEAYNLSEPIFEVVEALCPGFDIFYAEINYIRPGNLIKPHKDNVEGIEGKHWYLGGSKRVHVPLLTNYYSIMHCAGKSKYLPVGSIYEFHNNLTHYVTNDGVTPRVHLVVDLVPTKYRADLDFYLKQDRYVSAVHISKLK